MIAPWLNWAANEIGVAENPSPKKSDPRVNGYRAKSKSWTGDEDDGAVPWCAIFTNAALEETGIRGTRSAGARSYEHDRYFIRLDHFVPGCIVVFWRVSKSSGKGHVGFGLSETKSTVTVINGNSHDMVDVSTFAKSTATFGLIGYFWPVGVPTEPYNEVPNVKKASDGGRVV